MTDLLKQLRIDRESAKRNFNSGLYFGAVIFGFLGLAIGMLIGVKL